MIVAAYLLIGIVCVAIMAAIMGPKKYWFFLTYHDPNERPFQLVKTTTPKQAALDDESFGTQMMTFMLIMAWPIVLQMLAVFAAYHCLVWLAMQLGRFICWIFAKAKEAANEGDQEDKKEGGKE